MIFVLFIGFRMGEGTSGPVKDVNQYNILDSLVHLLRSERSHDYLYVIEPFQPDPENKKKDGGSTVDRHYNSPGILYTRII